MVKLCLARLYTDYNLFFKRPQSYLSAVYILDGISVTILMKLVK